MSGYGDDVGVVTWNDVDRSRLLMLMPIGSTIVRTLVYPASLVKTRLQTSNLDTGLWAAMKNIVRTEGFRGLYKGFGVSMMSTAVGPVYITALETTRATLTEHLTAIRRRSEAGSALAWHESPLVMSPTRAAAVVSLFGGFCATMVSQTLMVPIDVVTQLRMIQRTSPTPSTSTAPSTVVKPPTAASSTAAASAAAAGTAASSASSSSASASASSTAISRSNAGPVQLVRLILKQEGLRGLYRGYPIALVAYMPTSGLVWAAFELTHRSVRAWGLPLLYPGMALPDIPRSVTLSMTAFSGAVAGGVAAVVTNPLDVLRTRTQTLDVRTPLLTVAKDTYREGGVKAFYRGSNARALAMVPSTTLMLTAYEVLKQVAVLPTTQDGGDGDDDE